MGLTQLLGRKVPRVVCVAVMATSVHLSQLQEIANLLFSLHKASPVASGKFRRLASGGPVGVKLLTPR